MDAVARAQAILRADGPQSEDDLVERLRAEGLEVGDPRDLTAELEGVWWIGPDLLVAGEQIVAGGVLSHRLRKTTTGR